MDKINRLFQKSRENTTEFMNKIQNGRVDISGKPTTRFAYPFFMESNTGNILYKKEALKSILQKSPVHNNFFSKKNIDILQKIIRYQVWLQSGKKHIIDRQSDNQLQIIMRSIFLQYGKHRNKNVRDQLKELNEIVCQYAVPNILSNVELYIGFKKAVSQLPEPIPLPKSMSSAGMKGIGNKIV